MASTSNLSRIVTEFSSSFKKDFKIYLRYPGWFVGEFLGAPLWFIFFALSISLFTPVAGTSGEAFDIRYFFWGWFFLAYFSTSVWAVGHTLRNEQLSGTLEQLFLTPTNRLALLTGRTLRAFIIDSIAVIYFAILFSLIAKTSLWILDPALFASVFLAMLIMFAGFGMIYASLVMRLKTPEALTEVLQFVVIILSGIFFPVTVMPKPLFTISLFVPFTYAVDLLRTAAFGSPSLIENHFFELILLYALAVGILILGIKVFSMFEANAKRSGRLGIY